MDFTEYEALETVHLRTIEDPIVGKRYGLERAKDHVNITCDNNKIREEILKYRKSKLAEKYDAQFSQLPPSIEDFTLYRGIGESNYNPISNYGFEVVEKAKPRDVIFPDLGYSYNSLSRNFAKNYANSLMGKNIMFEIKIPKCAKVSRGPLYGEVIMPRGAEYKLIEKGVDPEGRINIVMEYILPKS